MRDLCVSRIVKLSGVEGRYDGDHCYGNADFKPLRQNRSVLGHTVHCLKATQQIQY